MGSISVKKVKSAFPLMTDGQMTALVGKSNFVDSDIIPISRFASSSNIALQKFAAQNDEKILGLVSPSVSETISGTSNPKVRKISNIFTGTYADDNLHPGKESVFTNYKKTV